MDDKSASPMEILNHFKGEVKAEFQSAFRNTRRSAGQHSNKIPGKDSKGNPGKLEVYFENGDKNIDGFVLILTFPNIPFDSGNDYRGIKIITGKIRPIFNNNDGQPVYREPHHTEFIQDLTNGKLIVKLHYKLKVNTEVDTIAPNPPMEKHEDPEIIHPDKP